MKETTIRLHSFLTLDAKAREHELDRMALSGWELVKANSLFARFRRTERTDLTYFVDWYDPKRPEAEDYRRLCADAGWELVQELGYENIYASRPDSRPAPIQTDPALEYQRFRKKVLRRMALAEAPLLLFALLVFLLSAGLGVDFMGALRDSLIRSSTVGLVFLFLPFLIPACVLYIVLSVGRLRAWRAAVDAGEPLPVSSPAAVRLGMLLNLLLQLFVVPLSIAFAADMLLSPSSTSKSYLIGMLIGGFIVLSRAENARRQRRSLLLLGFTVLLLLCNACSRPLRAEYPGRIPAAPVLEESLYDSYAQERGDALLGSYASWTEHIPVPGDPSGAMLALHVTARVWAHPVWSSLLRAELPADLVPAAGWEGVWQTARAEGSSYEWEVVLRRDDREVTLRYDCDTPIPDLVDRTLAWMDP